MPIRKADARNSRRKSSMPYLTSEMSAIVDYVSDEIGNEAATQNIHFSPTALTMVRHVMMKPGSIITDTRILLGCIDRQMADRLGLGLYCFIDNLQIKEMAEQQRTTRAEIAMDHALAMEGLKLIAVGTAPMALGRLLARSATREMKDVVVIATPNAFTNAIQLKERIWESDIPCVVVRGKRGGNPVAGSLVNALMAQALRQKEL